MRYLTLFNEYLRGTRDYSEWSHIYDLLMQIDAYNDCIEEMKLRGRLSKKTDNALALMTWSFPFMQYWHMGWLESRVRSFKSELKRKYGISVDAFMEISGEPEEIVDGQISIEDYVFSLKPVFRVSRPDLIEVHP